MTVPAIRLGLVVLPVLSGITGALIQGLAGRILVDPLSLIALGILGSLGVHTWLRTGPTIWVIRIAWTCAVVTIGWVLANRIASVPTGAFRPGELVASADLIVGGALAWIRWGDPVRTTWRRYHEAVGNPDEFGNAWSDRANQRILITVASAMRLMFLFRVPVFVIGDSGVYTKTAMTFTASGSFAPLDGFYPPAYPVFVAVIQMVLGPDFLGVAAVQHALGVVTVLATYGVARMALPPTWAMVPALAMAVNGYLLILEHGIYTEALFIPLVTVGAWLTLCLLRKSGLGTSVATGVVIAVASLTRLVLQPFLGAVMLLAIASGGWPIQRMAVFRAIAVGGSFVVVVTPWAIHNQVVHGYLGLSNGIGVSALLPRLWEEEATYTWENPSHPNPDVRAVLRGMQEQRDRGASYWQAWMRARRDFPDRNTSTLVAAAATDVMWRHAGLFTERTWFRMQRMWRGGFGAEQVNDLFGEQGKLGIRSPVFMVRDDGDSAEAIEQAGAEASGLSRNLPPRRRSTRPDPRADGRGNGCVRGRETVASGFGTDRPRSGPPVPRRAAELRPRPLPASRRTLPRRDLHRRRIRAMASRSVDVEPRPGNPVPLARAGYVETHAPDSTAGTRMTQFRPTQLIDMNRARA